MPHFKHQTYKTALYQPVSPIKTTTAEDLPKLVEKTTSGIEPTILAISATSFEQANNPVDSLLTKIQRGHTSLSISEAQLVKKCLLAQKRKDDTEQILRDKNQRLEQEVEKL